MAVVEDKDMAGFDEGGIALVVGLVKFPGDFVGLAGDDAVATAHREQDVANLVDVDAVDVGLFPAGAVRANGIKERFRPPPHAGHVFVGHTAEQLAARLDIVVCTQPDDSLSAGQRVRRLQALFKETRVRALPMPQADDWRGLARQHDLASVDVMVESNDRSRQVAAALGVELLLLDPLHEAMPADSAALHPDTYVLPEMRRDDAGPLRRVCLYGAESTGKTTLARQLAAHYDTRWLPEYGRLFEATVRPKVWCPADFVTIARVHGAMRRALAWQTTRLLIEDTDELGTRLWSEVPCGEVDAWFDRLDAPPDLYLVTDTDVPWQADGMRKLGAADERQHFQTRSLELLEEQAGQRGLRHVRLPADPQAMFGRAVAAIDRLLAEPRGT